MCYTTTTDHRCYCLSELAAGPSRANLRLRTVYCVVTSLRLLLLSVDFDLPPPCCHRAAIEPPLMALLDGSPPLMTVLSFRYERITSSSALSQRVYDPPLGARAGAGKIGSARGVDGVGSRAPQGELSPVCAFQLPPVFFSEQHLSIAAM